MVQKVVYNTCYGGFGLHNDVARWAREHENELRQRYDDEDVDEIVNATLPGEHYDDGSGPKADYHDTISRFDLSRDNELMADVVSGESDYDGRINGSHSSLSVAEVPDGVSWTIDEYDGVETVEEKSRSFS